MATLHAVMNRVTFTKEELLFTDSNYLRSGNLVEKSLFLDIRSVLFFWQQSRSSPLWSLNVDLKHLLCLAAELAEHPHVVFSVKWL